MARTTSVWLYNATLGLFGGFRRDGAFVRYADGSIIAGVGPDDLYCSQDAALRAARLDGHLRIEAGESVADDRLLAALRAVPDGVLPRLSLVTLAEAAAIRRKDGTSHPLFATAPIDLPDRVAAFYAEAEAIAA